MKILIVYSDFNSATKGNAVLENSLKSSNIRIRWKVMPWRVDMLDFPPTAKKAFVDALGAHIIVFAGRCAQFFTFSLEGWLEHWAKHRQIKNPALGIMATDAVTVTEAWDVFRFAKRNDLNVICDKLYTTQAQSSLAGIHSAQHQLEKLPLPQGAMSARNQNSHLRWGLNE